MTTSNDPSDQVQDWREQCVERIRGLILSSGPGISEERKWRKPSNPDGVPTFISNGIICTLETYKDKVKLTFARGASLTDEHHLFNASLTAGTRRALDIFEADVVRTSEFQDLIREAAAFNAR